MVDKDGDSARFMDVTPFVTYIIENDDSIWFANYIVFNIGWNPKFKIFDTHSLN